MQKKYVLVNEAGRYYNGSYAVPVKSFSRKLSDAMFFDNTDEIERHMSEAWKHLSAGGDPHVYDKYYWILEARMILWG
jgi:hypothetical protein